MSDTQAALEPPREKTELPFDLRTEAGVEEFAASWHGGLASVFEKHDRLPSMAYVFVTVNPDTEEQLERPRIVRCAESSAPSATAWRDSVRHVALRYRACGVALVMPVMYAQEWDPIQGVVGLEPNLRAALVIDHMSVASRVWTVKVERDETWTVGEMIKQDAPHELCGFLADMLPQKRMD